MGARAIAIAMVVALTAPASADSWFDNRLFFFAGTDMARASMSGWAGAVVAPFGNLDEDGTRFKIAGSGSGYAYRAGALPSGENEGRYGAGEVLVGRRMSFDAIVVTTYIGGYGERQMLREPDPGNPAVGSRFGIKAAAEVYARVFEHYVVTLFGNAATVYGTYNARAMVLREFWPAIALGVEAGLLGNNRHHEARSGVAAQLTWERRIVTLRSALPRTLTRASAPT